MVKVDKEHTRRRQACVWHLNLLFCSFAFLFALTGCGGVQVKPSPPQPTTLLGTQQFVVSIQGTQTRRWSADDTFTVQGCTLHAYGSGVETLTFHTMSPLYTLAYKQGTNDALLQISPNLASTPPAPTPFEFEMATSFAYQGKLQGDVSGQCTPTTGGGGGNGEDYCSPGEHPLKFVLDYHSSQLTLDKSSNDQAWFNYGSCNNIGTAALAGPSSQPPVFGTLPASILLLPQIQPYSVHVHVSQPLCANPCPQGLYQNELSNTRAFKSDDLTLDWTATFVSHSCNFPQVGTSAAIEIARQTLLKNSPSFQDVVNQLQQATQKSGGQVLIDDKQDFKAGNGVTRRFGQPSDPHYWQSVQLGFHWSGLPGINLMGTMAHEYWHAKEVLIDHGFISDEAAAFLQPEQFYDLRLSEEDGSFHFETKVLQDLAKTTGPLADCAQDILNSNSILRAINNGDEQGFEKLLVEAFEKDLVSACKLFCDGYISDAEKTKEMLSVIKPQVDAFLNSPEWQTIQQTWDTFAKQIPIPYH